MRRPTVQPIRPDPASVLRFAEHVCRAVRKDRLKKRRERQMPDADVARDIALAQELARWAQERVLSNAPLN